MWFYMYCQIHLQSQSMYTPPRLVVKQSGSMGGSCQTFGECKVQVMSALRMYTPPRLVVKQSGSMGGSCQTFGECKVQVMSALPYSLCTKSVFTPPLVTLTNYILT